MLRPLIKRVLRSEIASCLLAAILLILAHPTYNLWILAWFALLPLFSILEKKSLLGAFRTGYLCGLLFFTGSLYWFFNIARWFSFIGVIGIIFLFLYLSVYFGLFGMAYSYFSRLKPIQKLFILPSAWVALEYLRAHAFTGFDWVSLGHSQYLNLALIQIAEYTGVFGISFMVVMANVLINESLKIWKSEKEDRGGYKISILIISSALIFVPALIFGMKQVSLSENQYYGKGDYSVAIVQGNIPQGIKWDKAAWDGIMDKYLDLTRQAALHQPDLIIWPETSYPGYLWDDKEQFVRLQAFVKNIQIPLIVGSVLKEEKDYFNSALLLSGSGDIAQTYRKVHLVPFGEFLPLRKHISLIAQYIPIGDFTAGEEWTVFWPQPDPSNPAFSVLICFEDTVSAVAREFVRNGAQFLVNITNDAWFGDTNAPFMHMQSAVFRTVENRRSLIRAANTGLSCFIDRWGRAYGCVKNKGNTAKGQTYVKGYSVASVAFNGQKTFYTKYGDVFTIFCFGCILLGIIGRIKNINISRGKPGRE